MSAVLHHRLKAALGLAIAWPGRTPEEIEKFLFSYEAEVLREAAAKIRGDIGDFLAEWPDEPRRSPFVNGMTAAADLIDPDKEGS